MVRTDDQLCWRERLARKEAMNVVDAAGCDDHAVAAEGSKREQANACSGAFCLLAPHELT
jgi:hypothetical protein